MVEDRERGEDSEGVEWLDGDDAPSAEAGDGDAAEDADVDAAEDADVDAAEDTDSDAAEDTDSDAVENADAAEDADSHEGSEASDDGDDHDEYGVTLDSAVESERGAESGAEVRKAVEYDSIDEFEDLEDDVDEIDEGLLGEAPESDQEMPLTSHIEEMMRRLGVVFLVGGLVTLTLFPGADAANTALGLDFVSATDVINYLWNTHIPGAPEIPDRRPRVYGPLELILTELKVAALGGFVVGLPVLVYETYLFMRPGLYSRERRYYLAAIPTSLVLATVGILFSHFIILPIIFQYFTSYTTGTAVVAFGLRETFNLILILMGYNALIFQIPLFIMLAIMMGLTTREWLEDKRLLFWGGFAGVAFLINPDPTGMAPIIITATMITLFEGTLLLLRWTGN